ncbi:unnamed protein product [Allacma fusca]|uniref:Uncharacterized protein n=1 Tax=Allacma fusca TaxID=39272 RepID=A0A8J2LN12_9HEXA|nr:unnamed protein product [Allacma fusca]
MASQHCECTGKVVSTVCPEGIRGGEYNYFRLLCTNKETRSILVLPNVNVLGELYLKEVIRAWKQLMHFYVGYPDHPRLVVCTHDQILQKFVEDRRTEPVITPEPAQLLSDEVITDNKKKSTKRPDLPLYVSPALRHNGKQNKVVNIANTKTENAKNESSLPKDFNFVQPEEDECWKQLSISQLEEIYHMLGNVDIMKPKLEEYPEEMKVALKEEALSHIVEVYNMNKDIKTKDIMSLFDTSNGIKNHLKWVDDEHAMLIFSTPDLAKEALKVSHPVILTRLIENGSMESKLKIMSCSHSSHLLPWKARPKTVTVLARRLISSQLGPEFQVVSPEVLQKESKIIKEALAQKREKDKERLSRRETANGPTRTT